MARMISRQESAELLGCSLQTVTNWVERGLLKGHVIGHALMVDRDSIQQYFDDLKELGAMAEQISDMKSEYKTILKNFKEVLGEARGLYIEPARARDVFRANQLVLMNLCEGYLGKRQREIFSALIYGEKPDDLAKRLGLTRERTIQLAIMAATKLSDIRELKEIHETNKALKAENEQLRQLISKRDEQLKEYEMLKKRSFPLLEKRLENYNLSVRTLKALYNKNCKTIGDLVKLNRWELMNTRNMGMKSLAEIEELLSSIGLHLGMKQ